jgi:hypothetical protein
MYTENRARDIALFARAVLSNQLARWRASRRRPTSSSRTGSGAGNEEHAPAQVAAYFAQCLPKQSS